MGKVVKVNDEMQNDYTYELVEREGKNFDPEFKPDITPKKMLELGVFGGKYMADRPKEFPSDWYTNAKFSSEGRDCQLNYFGTCASQPLSVWQKKGWINDEHDPRGWFQWYCRYYMGRRLPEEDERQIKRWKAFRRHSSQVQKNCRTGTRHADLANVRHFSIGHMIVGSFNKKIEDRIEKKGER